MPLDYVGVPDWCGEAANRKRLEDWYAGFGPGGIPCQVCDLRKLQGDFRKLARHLAAGKEKVSVKQPAPGQQRAWSLKLLAVPPALVDGRPSTALEIVHMQLTCNRCHSVLLFDARAIGIAI